MFLSFIIHHSSLIISATLLLHLYKHFINLLHHPYAHRSSINMVARKTFVRCRGDEGISMSNETMGIGSVFLLTFVLLLLRYGLMLIGRRRQRPHGVYFVRLNRDD